MKKKLIALSTAILMMLAAASCGQPATTTTQATQPASTPATESEKAPEESTTPPATETETEKPTETETETDKATDPGEETTTTPADTEPAESTSEPDETEPDETPPALNPDAPTSLVPYEMVKSYDDVKTYTFLMCWNGGAGSYPHGFEDGPIAKAIEERTGVRLEVETIVSSEREKLAQVFASGLVPDITNAPHWSTNPGGEGELIKNAAIDGLLLDLEGLYQDFPNVTRLMNEGVSTVYLEDHLKHPDYNGSRYVIPTQTPRTDDDVQNWAYAVFVRKDILTDLGYEPEQINNPDMLYELLTGIKNGNYVDVNDRPVIPAGSWHNGWSFGSLLSSFGDMSATGWYVDEDGKVNNDIFADWQEERLMFMRKLVKEGLLTSRA